MSPLLRAHRSSLRRQLLRKCYEACAGIHSLTRSGQSGPLRLVCGVLRRRRHGPSSVTAFTFQELKIRRHPQSALRTVPLCPQMAVQAKAPVFSAGRDPVVPNFSEEPLPLCWPPSSAISLLGQPLCPGHLPLNPPGLFFITCDMLASCGTGESAGLERRGAERRLDKNNGYVNLFGRGRGGSPGAPSGRGARRQRPSADKGADSECAQLNLHFPIVQLNSNPTHTINW